MAFESGLVQVLEAVGPKLDGEASKNTDARSVLFDSKSVAEGVAATAAVDAPVEGPEGGERLLGGGVPRGGDAHADVHHLPGGDRRGASAATVLDSKAEADGPADDLVGDSKPVAGCAAAAAVNLNNSVVADSMAVAMVPAGCKTRAETSVKEVLKISRDAPAVLADRGTAAG